VTVAQYTEFLNAVAAMDTNGLYTAAGIVSNGPDGNHTYTVVPGFENKPVEGLSFWDGARFANWMNNGQPIGAQDNSTTEDGSYTLTAQGIATNSVVRNKDASIFLPSENEWYKAAYFDPALRSYYDYPTGTNIQIACVAPSADTGNSANCNNAVGSPTDVGAYALSKSPYGTFDQGGNRFEWTDTIHQDDSGFYRVKRGGNWRGDFFGTPNNASASVRYGVWANFRSDGFHVVRISAPRIVPIGDFATPAIAGLLVMTGILGR